MVEVDVSAFGRSLHLGPGPVPDPGPDPERPVYFDVAAMLDGGLPDPPAPDVLARSDGLCLFCSGQVNLLFGDPESGKTFVAPAAVAETLRVGRSALVVDLDHSLRVRVTNAFVPGRGGAAHLLIHKDRHGGLRRHSPSGDYEPLAGTFTLTTDPTGATTWKITAPTTGDRNPAEAPAADDVEAIAALNPPPTSVEDARSRLGWRKERATVAVRQWRAEVDLGGAER